VTELQYRLRSYGYSLAVDGDFGQVTEDRVLHLQHVSGLLEDGIVGPITQKALGCGRAPVSAPPAAPRPTPTRAPAPRPVASQGGWHDLAIAAGWTEDQWPKLSCIIQRESRGQAGVINSAGATGLLQILKKYHRGDDLFDPFTNLRVGHEMFLSSGWSPWHAPAGIKQC
jgi:peptidoglycan hydrolase-like protein with peptidoglycan-binding domain